MRVFSFLDPFIAKLSNGRFLRFTFALLLRISAWLAGVSGVILVFIFLGAAFRSSNVGMILGSIIAAVFSVALVFCQIAILLYRARTIAELPDSNYTIIPIFSILLRQCGESALAAYSLIGVGGCLFIWLTDSSPLSQLSGLQELTPMAMPGAGAGFLGGLWFLVAMLVLAFLFILVFYFLAELIEVLPEIANNTKAMQLALAGSVLQVAPSPEPVSATPPIAVVKSPDPSCKCGAAFEADSPFCGSCGARKPVLV